MRKLATKWKKMNKGQRGFIIRLSLFFVIYAAVFLLHPWFTKFIHGYQINNYQPYLLYFIFPSLLVFAIFKWKEITHFRSYKNSIWQTLFFGGIALYIFSLSMFKWLVIYKDIIPHNFLYLYPMIIGYVSLFLAIFNLKFSKWFSSELLLIPYLFAFMIALQVIVESQWLYLSGGLLYPLHFLLSPFSETVAIDPSQLEFTMEKFSVNIGATCSGIYSIITFIFLFVAAALLIHKNHKIDQKKAAVALAAGILLIFLLNIVRIAIIILIGAYIDADLAIELFHEFLSAIFLIAVFVGYLYLVFPRILKKR